MCILFLASAAKWKWNCETGSSCQSAENGPKCGAVWCNTADPTYCHIMGLRPRPIVDWTVVASDHRHARARSAASRPGPGRHSNSKHTKCSSEHAKCSERKLLGNYITCLWYVSVWWFGRWHHWDVLQAAVSSAGVPWHSANTDQTAFRHGRITEWRGLCQSAIHRASWPVSARAKPPVVVSS